MPLSGLQRVHREKQTQMKRKTGNDKRGSEANLMSRDEDKEEIKVKNKKQQREINGKAQFKKRLQFNGCVQQKRQRMHLHCVKKWGPGQRPKTRNEKHNQMGSNFGQKQLKQFAKHKHNCSLREICNVHGFKLCDSS